MSYEIACNECHYWYKDENCVHAYCHFQDDGGVPPCEEGLEEVPMRYTVSYEGFLFYGDSEGINSCDYDRWEDVQSLIDFYGTVEGLNFEVKDNWYDVIWSNGEWY